MNLFLGAEADSAPLFLTTPAISGLGLGFRAETEADEPFLRQLYTSMRWQELERAIGWSDEQKIAFLHEQFSFQRRAYTIEYKQQGGRFLIVQRQGCDAGRLYLWFNPKKSDLRVVDLGFLPEFRNKGYGSAIFAALFAKGDATGCRISIHVEEFNPARRLYERLGFQYVPPRGDDNKSPYLLMERLPLLPESVPCPP